MRVSIYTDIDGAPVGFLGNAESAESARICAILCKILMGVVAFLRPFPVFTMFPIRGRAFAGRHFRVFVAEIGTYLRQLLDGVFPSIPTSMRRPVGFWEFGKCRKCRDFRRFGGNPYGGDPALF